MKQRITRKSNIIFLSIYCFLLNNSIVNANSNLTDAVEKITDNGETTSKISQDVYQIVSQKNFLADIGRQIFEWWMQAMWYSAKAVEEVFSNIITKFNFTKIFFNIDGMDNIFSSVFIFLFIGIVIAGLSIMIKGSEEDNILPKTIKGLLITILILSAGSFGSVALTNAQTEVGSTLFSKGNSSMVKKIFQSNIYNVELSLNANKIVTLEKNNIHPLQDLKEAIETKSDNVTKKFSLAYDKQGKEIVKEKKLSEKTWFWESDEVNYKYKPNYAGLTIFVCIYILTMLLNAFKVSRNGIEFFTNLPVIFAVASTDIANNAKKKNAIMHNVNLVMVNVYILVILFLFPMLYTAINGVVLDGNIVVVTMTKILVNLALFWAILDGSEFVVKLTGMDAGLKGGLAPMVVSYKLGKGAINLASGISSKLGFGNRKDDDKSKNDDEDDTSNNDDKSKNDDEENSNDDNSISNNEEEEQASDDNDVSKNEEESQTNDEENSNDDNGVSSNDEETSEQGNISNNEEQSSNNENNETSFNHENNNENHSSSNRTKSNEVKEPFSLSENRNNNSSTSSSIPGHNVEEDYYTQTMNRFKQENKKENEG